MKPFFTAEDFAMCTLNDLHNEQAAAIANAKVTPLVQEHDQLREENARLREALKNLLEDYSLNEFTYSLALAGARAALEDTKP